MQTTTPTPTPEDREEFSDIAALELAIEKFTARPGRARQVAGKAEQGDSWREIAELAAYSEQMDSLKLFIGAAPPCWQCANAQPETDDEDDVRAFQILQEMRQHGVSDYHPDPIKAIEAAQRKARRRPA